MASLFDLIKYAPEGTTPGITAPNPYDWSSLPYYGLMPQTPIMGGFDSQAGGAMDTGIQYANVALPGYKQSGAYPNFSFQDTFGGHSGITQNPDGTFTATRAVQDSPDKSAYETTSYRVSDDGKSLVPVNNQWTPITIKDTGFWESVGGALEDIAPLALGVAGVYGLGGLLAGGAGAGTAAAGTAAFDPLNAYLTTGGVEGSIAGGAAAGGGAAGAVGIMGPPVAEMAGLLPGVAPTSPYVLPTNAALIESAVGTEGYGASSAGAGGGPGTLTGPTAGMLPGTSGPTVGAPSVPSPVGSAASGLWDFVKNNPNLLGTLVGGLLGGGASGGGGSYDVGDRTPLNPLQRPVFSPKQVDYGQGLPGGLGSQSAGLFADYMRRNRGT